MNDDGFEPDDPRDRVAAPGWEDGPARRRSGGGGADAQEAQLLDYFAERFDLAPPTAKGAIAYMERVTGAIDRLRDRLEATEARATALDDALARAGGAPAGETLSPEPRAAAWSLALEGARSLRVAAPPLRGSPDFDGFERLVGIEDATRRLMAAQARALKPSAQAADDAALAEEDWPHALWRAEALLTAYFPTSGDWGDLRHGASVAAAALRQVLLLQGVAVGHVRLLSPYDPADGEAWSDSADGLSATPAIRERLRPLAEAGVDDLVIDCESFGFTDERRGLAAPARLITYAPEKWA